MTKLPLFFVLSLLLIVANNLFFGMHELTFVHGFQVVLEILLFLYFTWSMFTIKVDYFPKKYEIPLFIAFIFAARSTESIVRKLLIRYSPEFYQAYKLYIFAFSIILFLVIVYFLQKSIGKKHVKID